jgi:nucleoside-diphosphate-sugar epimerase
VRVLVTGATGFVGRHVVSELLSSGHKVTAVARDTTKARGFSWFDKVDFIPRDIYEPVEDALRLFGRPDAVIHLAWPGLPNYDQLFHFERNLFADYQFLKSMIGGGMNHLLVAGTCFEYGMQNGSLSEDMPTAPRNPYALAKDTLRRFLETLTRNKGVALQWARLFYMYGPGQNPNSLLSQLDRALDRGEPVFNMSGGEQLRDYLHVERVAARLVALVAHPQHPGIFNICSGEPISVRRLVEQHIVVRGSNIRLNLGYYPYSDFEPMAFWGDTRKLTSIIGSK